MSETRFRTSGRPFIDRAAGPCLWVHATLTYAFLFIPIIVLLVFSFTASRRATIWGGFSLDPYIRLFGLQEQSQEEIPDIRRDSGRDLVRSLNNSLVIAVAVTLISTVLGVLAAIWLERYANRKWLSLYDSAISLPILIPGIVQGISLLIFFALISNWVTRAFGGQPLFGKGTVIIGQSAFTISYVAIIVRARLAGLSPSIEEAAMDLGANQWQVLSRITLPMIWPGVLGGALLAFTISMDEFVVTFFTAGPRATTLPIRIWSMVKVGVSAEVNALSSIILVVSILLVSLSIIIQRKKL
ncbi:MAG: ABC transporter permease [Planctomycetota bacterium]|nr:ABC transporter permease [Planctomycetota bacterium]